MKTKVNKKIEKKHRHHWEEHCDCEYCNLQVCYGCGEERDGKPVKIHLNE